MPKKSNLSRNPSETMAASIGERRIGAIAFGVRLTRQDLRS
jgi:hypothetical protein